MDLYFTKVYVNPDYPVLPFPDNFDKVKYIVDGKAGSVREWATWQETDIKRQLWISPPGIRDKIIRELLKGPRKLVLTVHPGKDYEGEYVFYPQGFREAARPVLRACGW